MDPNATLARIRRLIDPAIIDEAHHADLVEITEAIRDLDEWLTGGGFLPTAWQAGRSAALAQARSRYPVNRRDALFPTTRRPIF